MDPVTIGLGVASIGSSILGGLSASKKAKSAARQQSRLTYQQRQEEIRRMRGTAAQEKGRAVAGVFASNVLMSGSSARYVKALNMENMREIAFARSAAIMERRAIRKGASGVGSGLYAQAAGDAIGLAANLYANRAITPDPGLGSEWAGNDPFKPAG